MPAPVLQTRRAVLPVEVSRRNNLSRALESLLVPLLLAQGDGGPISGAGEGRSVRIHAMQVQQGLPFAVKGMHRLFPA